MNIENIIIDKISYLIIIMIIGFIGAKLKVINEEVTKGLSRLLLNISLPLLLFTTFISKEFSYQIFINCLFVLFFSFLAIFILYVTGFISSKFLRMDRNKAIVHILHTTHGNIAFVGLPIIGSIFGPEGMLYASIFILANDSVLWSLSIFLLNYKNNTSIKKGLLHLVNPITISFILGIIGMLVEIKIPLPLLNPIVDLGHITIILSMLYIGAMLSFIKVHHIFKHYNLYILSFNKLLLVPVIMIVIMNLLISLFNINADFQALSIVIIQVAMPANTVLVILAKEFGGDFEQATENMLVTTIISIFTIPYIIYLVNQYLII